MFELRRPWAAWALILLLILLAFAFLAGSTTCEPEGALCVEVCRRRFGKNAVGTEGLSPDGTGCYCRVFAPVLPKLKPDAKPPKLKPEAEDQAR